MTRKTSGASRRAPAKTARERGPSKPKQLAEKPRPPEVEPAQPQALDAPPQPPPRRRRRLVSLLVIVAVAPTAVALLLTRSHGRPFQLELGVPTEVTAGELSAFASPARPVYWVGRQGSTRLEVTRTSRGAVFVRYLPPGIDIGDRSAEFTTIATYPVPNARAFATRAAGRPGAVHAEAKGGALAVWQRTKATNVYVAFPSSDYLVEVYDSSPRRARTLALAKVRPVP